MGSRFGIPDVRRLAGPLSYLQSPAGGGHVAAASGAMPAASPHPRSLRRLPARYLALRPTTFATWAKGYSQTGSDGRQVHKSPVVTALPAPFRGGPTVPFIGLAEGLVLAAFRQAHVPLRQIRPALDFLRDQVGMEHALASRRLYLAGAELLWDYAQHADADPRAARGVRELVAIRSGGAGRSLHAGAAAEVKAI